MSDGFGITFIDLDETLFHTFAKIKVTKFGKVVKELDNQEFNTYELRPGESFDFSAFKDAKFFKETSEPIPKVIERVKKMIRRIRETSSESRIIILTARKDLDDKNTFLEAFRQHGIDVDDRDVVYIERAGNLEVGSVAEKKQQIMLTYLNTGKYRRCRLIDDDEQNLRAFHELATMHAGSGIEFYGLLVQSDGTLKRTNA